MPKGLHKNAIDIMGQRFGRLVVTKLLGRDKRPSGDAPLRWECACDCGTITSALSAHLREGRTTSCGCYQKEWASAAHKTHGMRRSAEYRTWCNMRDRCSNPKNKAFARYGGRGIHVSEEWNRSFECFFRDMGPKPSKGHEIDRIDTNGPYAASNCRWATKFDQANNKSNNVRIEVDGIAKTVGEWSRVSPVTDKTIYKRLERGWSAKDAVFFPNGTIKTTRAMRGAARRQARQNKAA